MTIYTRQILIPSDIITSNKIAKQLYMEYSGTSRINISIDKSEVATVEKVLDALKIPYTEKLGEFLLLG